MLNLIREFFSWKCSPQSVISLHLVVLVVACLAACTAVWLMVTAELTSPSEGQGSSKEQAFFLFFISEHECVWNLADFVAELKR